ncbi:hypothetical protein HLB44_14510 [Aquincola sp. S2]|uniref:Uncharacterized protein n=1 Tax=Pseudaquabacterium terrae TaxID=2732868 RepID=A0ABX2EHW9_9BURK|nr:hypothetical protein [Aquabacterium terrae]NRF68203.1 hypothetical protein [Aquabacterium terrae]
MSKLPHRPGPDPDPGPQPPPAPDPGERLEHGSTPVVPEDLESLEDDALQHRHKREPA